MVSKFLVIVMPLVVGVGCENMHVEDSLHEVQHGQREAKDHVTHPQHKDAARPCVIHVKVVGFGVGCLVLVQDILVPHVHLGNGEKEHAKEDAHARRKGRFHGDGR